MITKTALSAYKMPKQIICKACKFHHKSTRSAKQIRGFKGKLIWVCISDAQCFLRDEDGGADMN